MIIIKDCNVEQHVEWTKHVTLTKKTGNKLMHEMSDFLLPLCPM